MVVQSAPMGSVPTLGYNHRMPTVQLLPEARQLLEEYRWPGNIRQLKNVTEQLSILEKEKEIDYRDINRQNCAYVIASLIRYITFISLKQSYLISLQNQLNETIYDNYLVEFGEINLEDPDLFENIADLICEKKKLSKTQIESIVENIKSNVKLIDLRLQNLPDEIIDKMESKYSK